MEQAQGCLILSMIWEPVMRFLSLSHPVRLLAILLLCLLFGWSLNVVLAQQPQPDPARERLAAGVAALKAGDLDTADTAFSEALRRGERTPMVLHNLGVIAQRRGNHAQAVTRFRQAIQLQPDYGPSRLLLGASLLALKRNTEAVSELKRAATLMPEEPQVHLQLAKAYESSEKWIAAVQELQEVEHLEPSDAESSYQLGRAWLKLAEWSYQRIRRLNPDSARLHQALGQEYAIQGKYDQAIAAYQKAAQTDPNLPEIHFALAVLLTESKQFDQALTEINRELQLVPESRAAIEMKGKIEAARGKSTP